MQNKDIKRNPGIKSFDHFKGSGQSVNPGPFEGCNVVIIDDDSVSALLITEYYCSLGITFYHQSLQGGFAMLPEIPFHMVIIGLDRNDLTKGFSLAEALKTKYPHCPLVIYSACTDIKELIPTAENVIDVFIAKPIRFEVLTAILYKHLTKQIPVS